VGGSFWHAENQLAAQITEPGDVTRLFVPLDKDDPLRAEYSRTASAADAFIKLADENKAGNWMRPAVLYLGGLAKYSLGDNAGALALLTRLQSEFPDYKRDQYINDRVLPDPKYSDPVAPGVSKLIFYLRFQVALQNTPDDFASLKQITGDSLTTLTAQREYARWLSSRSDRYNARTFDEARMGSQPDQRRASALPRTLALLKSAWDALLEKSLQKAGATALREWLRSLSQPDAPFSKQALYRLQTIDQLIIKQYFAEAQNAMNAKNFDAARAKYRQVMAEYSGTDAAKRAEEALPEIVPVAVNYYKTEGEQNFRASDPDQFMKPQTRSREFYERAYKEDPDGPQAAEMLYGWAKGLATEKGRVPDATKLMEQWMTKYPQDHPMRVQAMWQLAFFYAAQFKRYGDGVKLMEQIVREYPGTHEAAESLWHAAFLQIGIADGRREGYEKGLPYLEKYLKEYPKEWRWPYAQDWINRFKEKL
jgi:TolA-binding protein